MSLNVKPILNDIISHAKRLGHFEQVNGAPPANPPGTGLTAAVWLTSIEPAPGQSGLNATTARVVFTVQVFTSVSQQPADGIDPNLADATDALFTAYSGDFTLAGNVREVDLLGMTGVPMRAEAGYVQFGDKVYRVMTITLPLIVNDVWEQVP